MKRYLAYGSNLNKEQMRWRCPEARVVGTAVIEGYGLLFKGSLTGAYLTIEQMEGGKVPVAVWSVTERDEAALDRYEGYPRFYYRKEIILPITGIKSGKTCRRKAFVYIMHEDHLAGIPTPAYVQTCLEGYRDFGFDEKYIYAAIDRSRKAVEA